ncbi:porin [Parasalinivibrio latis]|uniref:porin n=1 Tax=Parasalinivibrio latis TaxID=2952610 RepID=UPI0030E2F84C
MNKKLIALAVAGFAASASVSAAEIYSDNNSAISLQGRMEARAESHDSDVNDISRARLGVMGQSQLTEGLYGVGYAEFELSNNNYADKSNDQENNLKTRYAYAGIGGNYGEVGFGRADGSLGMITDFTDIMSTYGAVASDKLTVADRVDNNMYYKGTFGGLTVKANYSFDNNSTENSNGTSNVSKADNAGYSLGAVYNTEMGLGFGLGYAQEQANDAKDNDQMMAAVNYTIGDLYFAGLYTNGNRNPDAVNDTANLKQGRHNYDGYELAAAYNLNQWVFTTTYGNGSFDSDTAVEAVGVDATYFFNNKFRAYAGYNFNLMSKSEVKAATDAEDSAMVGLRYDF